MRDETEPRAARAGELWKVASASRGRSRWSSPRSSDQAGHTEVRTRHSLTHTKDASIARCGYRLGSECGSPNHGKTLFSKRLMAQIRSPVRVRTNKPVPCRMPVGARR
jgi:hypothetical protein